MVRSVLLVEDDEQKRKSVFQFLEETFPEVRVTVTRSYQSCLSVLKQAEFDLILLDMSLPTFDIGSGEDGGRRLPYGGREILRKIERRSGSTAVIIMTQFEFFGEGDDVVNRVDLNRRLESDFSAIYRGMIFYSIASDSWKDQLIRMVIAIQDAK